MKTVYLCGSFRYMDQMVDIQTKLKTAKIVCSIPEIGGPKGIGGCLEQIRITDITFVINPDGYVGKSVSMDIGYALALNKEIYSLAPIEDPPIADLIGGAKSVDEIVQLASKAQAQ